MSALYLWGIVPSEDVSAPNLLTDCSILLILAVRQHHISMAPTISIWYSECGQYWQYIWCWTLSILQTLVLRGHWVVADVPVNSLALSELLQCKCSLDWVTHYNVAYLCGFCPPPHSCLHSHPHPHSPDHWVSLMSTMKGSAQVEQCHQ